MAKERIDILLVQRGLAESRGRAQRLVMAGQVRANGEVVPKPSNRISIEADIQVDRGPRFISRGGEKLQAGLDVFSVVVEEKICADVGASTGGFTDCLIQNGARKVYAIDVGHGILHWKLRSHPRVVVMERTNARYIQTLPEQIDLATVDASFISLRVLLPVMANWLKKGNNGGGEVIALIKPQFEAGRQETRRGKGVIKDPTVHRRVLLEILGFARDAGFGLLGLVRSPITGPKGNIEFVAWLKPGAGSHRPLEAAIGAVLD